MPLREISFDVVVSASVRAGRGLAIVGVGPIEFFTDAVYRRVPNVEAGQGDKEY